MALTYTERKVKLDEVAVQIVAQHKAKAQAKAILQQVIADLASLQAANTGLVKDITDSADADQKNELTKIATDFTIITNAATAAVNALG